MSRRKPPLHALFFPALTVALLSVALVGPAAAAEPSKNSLTPASLSERLKTKPTGAAAARLSEEIRNWFGTVNLSKGPAPRVEGTVVAWAIEAPGASAPPRIVFEQGAEPVTLARVGDTNVYAAATSFPERTAFRWAYEVNGKRLELPVPKNNSRQRVAWGQLEVYLDHPDSLERSAVPKGKLTPMPKWQSRVFEGASHDWWVYVPAQYSEDKPACVMVFQDGGGYKDFIPIVFDNLIAKQDMPVTVGVFVNPGTFENGRQSNRSVEYDTLSDQYARFLLDEILPETAKAMKVKLRRDPAGRAIAGISSGGICAWTVAWERPDEFSKVLSWVGSFTNIASGKTHREGGHNYEALIRKTPRRPIRAFLQDGANDLDNANGNWPLANQQMAKALAFAGYDFKFVFGNGFHSNKHGRAILPDSLRWLWRGWEAEQPR
jgi:enterochelin esterase-like enzyme